MNPFSPGDRVKCEAKSRRNGSVTHIICKDCEKCKSRSYDECTGAVKDHVLVSFYENNVSKKFKYHHNELTREPPLPPKPIQKTYDLSPKDIRPLGEAQISVPLIVSEDTDEPEEEEEVVTTAPETKRKTSKLTIKPANGMFFDQFLSQGHKMERPI